jgi:lipoic acid synthetase
LLTEDIKTESPKSAVQNLIPEIKNPLRIYDCGLADYRQILERQQRLCEDRYHDKISDTVLIAEHPPVITLGSRRNANKLLTGSDDLAQKHIDVVNIRRGGGATAHNPGQLVFYPILNLQQFGLSVSEYIRELETIGIELLEQLGVHSQRRDGFPGLWVNGKKIASIGVRISRFVTLHGMAINIQNDLSIFDHIVPCGLEGVKMTSVLNETGIQNSISIVKGKLIQLLFRHFSTKNSSNCTDTTNHEPRNLPVWLRRPLPAGSIYNHTDKTLNSLGLETICMHANCPNKGECWGRGTATVLILGNICTRNCGFCSVQKGKPLPPDPTEPQRIAQMVKQMNLKYLVITSVNRDDLPDGGAAHFCNCINTVRQQSPDVKFEILTPDFRHCQNEAIEILAPALVFDKKTRGPFVFAHNVETVPSLYPIARVGGDYRLSLNLLKIAKEKYGNVQTKSSIMLGLGENDDEVEQTLKDLRNVDCNRITIGQYLKPSKTSLDVVEYITPEKFDRWQQKAIQLGFSWVISAPFARSSYFAEKNSRNLTPV